MSEIIDKFYTPLLTGHGFIRDPDNQQYGDLGICWKLSPEVGEGTYWTYGQKDLYDIKIHNFSFHEDFMLEFSLPECLSITRYDSISGEELSPYRRLSAGCIKTFIGGYTPYKALIHKNIPIRSIGIEIAPAYYEDYASDIPLERLTQIACMGTTKLKTCFKKYYDCTITEYIQQRRMSQAEYLLAYTELTVGQVAQTVGYSTSSRFAELFRKSTGLLPLEYRKTAQRK